jgi:glycosyltransferase involved in cell wall biosynthesis
VIVLFSHDAFFQQYGGVSRCVVELLRRLNGQNQAWRVIAGRYGSRFLHEMAQSEPDAVSGVWSATAPGRIVAALHNEAKFARSVKAGKDVVVHRSYYPVIDRLPSHVPVIVTLHDMYWETPGAPRSLRHRLHSWIKQRALRRADLIICISQFTQDELASIWPEHVGKSKVIYHGVSRLALATKSVQTQTKNFIFVGDRGNRKNFAMALNGLAHSGLTDHGLLCLGGGALSKSEINLVSRLGLTGRVVQQAADDTVLASSYESAAALLYPSFYEGFGMPLIEAMLHGCPVIAAQASCLPEIGGDAALYAAPGDPHAWANALLQAIRPEIRSQLVARGHRRAADFSWESVARQYVSEYQQVAGQPTAP